MDKKKRGKKKANLTDERTFSTHLFEKLCKDEPKSLCLVIWGTGLQKHGRKRSR